MAATFRRKSKKDFFQEAAHAYMKEFGVTDFDPDEVAEWMVDTGQYEERPRSVIHRCKQELTEALRDEKIIDPAGRVVRAMHCVRYVNEDGAIKSTWATLFDAAPNHMRVSFQQNRRAIRGQVLQMHASQVSYNEFNKHGAQLDLFDHNYNLDIAESEMPLDYPDERPEGEDQPAGSPA